MKNKGITLIALVITIIVLLILAGVTITSLTGENGLLERASRARDETERAEVYEQISLAAYSGEMEHHTNGTDRITAYKNALLNDVDGIDASNLTDNGSSLITGTVTTKNGKQYDFSVPVPVTDITVAEHKEKNPNELTAADLENNASTYFGMDVMNYTSSLGENLQDIEWQLLYAGPLEGKTEKRIYLISKDTIKYSQVPTVIKNGSEVLGAKPIEVSGSDYAATFAKTAFSPSSGVYLTGGVITQYTGSSDITNTTLQSLNSKYYKWLTDNNKTSTNYNMKSVAYMMDTTTWEKFKGLNAEYAIGGPTIELLFIAYNKFKNVNYIPQVADIYGYQYSLDNGASYGNNSTSCLSNTYKPSPFLTSSQHSYWLSSNSSRYESSDSKGWNSMYIQTEKLGESYYGSIMNCQLCEDNSHAGFRPVVLLNSNCSLQKTKDSNDNDVLKIVE